MRKLFALLLLTLCSVGVMWGQGLVKPMSPARGVNDFAGLFSSAQTQILEDSLTAFKRATSNEVVIVTVNDLGDYDASEYAMNILREWGVGSKEKNNGVVLLIKPRNENGGGKVYISTGYGVEGALPDGRCGRIIDNEMMPFLKRGDYYGAANAGAEAIRKAIRGEYTADEKASGTNGLYGFMVALFILFILFAALGKKGGKGSDGQNSGGAGRGWVPPIIIGGLGGFGGRGSGGFGGGFGGFGGGSGGGGGAGRSF